MIREECFTRQHFWIEKRKKYHPLVEISSEFFVDFQWTDEFLLFCLREKSDLLFHVSWPDYQKKDALHFFIDTRPSLKVRTLQRHCHEFLLLPEAVDGVQTKEITKFHGYDIRPLIRENVIQVSNELQKKERCYHIKIPHEALFGFDEEVKEFSFAFSYFSEGKEPLQYPIPLSAPERIPYVWPICHHLR